MAIKEEVMKKVYEVEYINERGNFAIQTFGSKAAALKFAKSKEWIQVNTSNGYIIADNTAFRAMKSLLDETLKIR